MAVYLVILVGIIWVIIGVVKRLKEALYIRGLIADFSHRHHPIFVRAEHPEDKDVAERAKFYEEVLERAENFLNRKPGEWNVKVDYRLFDHGEFKGESWEEYHFRCDQDEKKLIRVMHKAIIDEYGYEFYTYELEGHKLPAEKLAAIT